MDQRDVPLSKECPSCDVKGMVERVFTTAPTLVSDSKSIHTRAGTEFNNRLKQIKKGSGRNNTIKHI
jgi:hypothetical protein